MNTKILAIGASVMLLAVAACDDAEPTPDPALAFCDSLEALAVSVESLETLDADSTVDEAREGMEAVEAAGGEVKDAAGDLAESQVEAIETAVGDLESYRDSIEDDATMADVIAGFAAQVAAIREARMEAGTVHCGLEEAEATVDEAEASMEAAATAVAEEVEEVAEEAQESAAAVAEDVEDAAEEAEDAASETVEEAEDAASEAMEEVEDTVSEATEEE